MTAADIVRIRLKSQCIGSTTLKEPKDVLAHLGAIQAQDYAMAKWAIGLRIKNGTEKAVDKAIDRGDILRTHVLRPTWHFVSAGDIYWMLALTAPRIKNSMTSRHKELGFSEAVLKKSRRILEKAVSNGEHVTREALLERLQAAKISTTENRASHLLFIAELDGILCSGASKNNKRTYALLESRVPKKITFSKEESLARLAGIYFNSRGAATLHDFTWWSGLSPADARKALEMIKPGLHEEIIDKQSYWLGDKTASKAATTNAILLPAFDEYLISYKDRTAAIHLHHQKKAFSSNGIFWPTLLVNGQVAGLWKRSIKKDKVLIEPELFIKPRRGIISDLKTPAKAFGHFLDKTPELLFP